MQNRRIAQLVFLFAVIAGGCDGSGGGGSTGGGGGGGGGGAAGSITPRRCGPAQPCSAGATCSYSGIESGVKCECDPSGHFFCAAWAGGGAPPYDSCDTESACADGGGGGAGAGGGAGGGSCSDSNGYCERTCTCMGSCSFTCNGDGPGPVDAGFVCAEGFCADDYWGWGGCSIQDGACDYTIDCEAPDTAPTVTGSCPAL